MKLTEDQYLPEEEVEARIEDAVRSILESDCEDIARLHNILCESTIEYFPKYGMYFCVSPETSKVTVQPPPREKGKRTTGSW